MRRGKTIFDNAKKDTAGKPNSSLKEAIENNPLRYSTPPPPDPDPDPTDTDYLINWYNKNRLRYFKYRLGEPPPLLPYPTEQPQTTTTGFILGERMQVTDSLTSRLDNVVEEWKGNHYDVYPYGNIPETAVRKVKIQLLNFFGGLPSKQVIQPQPQRDRHTYIIGKSGSGKTTLMLNMIYQDLKAGNGLGVIAPEQEMLTEQILPYIPENRIDDVIYFNPADENPIPFNPLNLEPDEDADLKADEVMTIFKRIIGTEGTPRIDEILRQSIYALLTTPNTTILDIPKLLDRADPDYRHQIISQLQDEYCAHFWRDTYPQFPKDAHLPVLYRISAFTRDKRIRNTLCQTGQSLNFRQVMDSGKIVLFNLSDGILGEQNSQLLGQLIVSQFQLAVASRANIPEQQRKRFYLYIDEFQTFTNTAASSYEKILSRARKYRLALILAHQQTGQIPGELLRDIFGNVSTMISFTVSHADATKLSKEFLTEQDGKLAPTPPEKFIELQIGETYCKLGRESFKMKTPLITEQPNWDIKEKILEQSRNQFTSDTPTPTASSKSKPPEQPEQSAPDEPLFTKPKIKPTGKIK